MKKTFTVNLNVLDYVRPTNLNDDQDFLCIVEIQILPDFMFVVSVIDVDGRIYDVKAHAWEEWYIDE